MRRIAWLSVVLGFAALVSAAVLLLFAGVGTVRWTYNPIDCSNQLVGKLFAGSETERRTLVTTEIFYGQSDRGESYVRKIEKRGDGLILHEVTEYYFENSGMPSRWEQTIATDNRIRTSAGDYFGRTERTLSDSTMVMLPYLCALVSLKSLHLLIAWLLAAGMLFWVVLPFVGWYRSRVGPQPGRKSRLMPRLLAFLLDVSMINAIAISTCILFLGRPCSLRLAVRSLLGNSLFLFPTFTFLAAAFLAALVSGVYFSTLTMLRGQTVGKAFIGSEVVAIDSGSHIHFRQSFGRWLGYSVSFLPFCYGFLCIPFHGAKMGIHDYLAQTTVLQTARRLSWKAICVQVCSSLVTLVAVTMIEGPFDLFERGAEVTAYASILALCSM